MFRILISLLILMSAVNGQAQVNLIPFVSGWARITEISQAGDDRLFIVDSYGRIKVVRLNGSINTGFFLDISSKVTSAGSEQGLLGLAFSPDFNTDRTFYVNYTGAAGSTYISRFRVSAANPDSADPSSEEVLLTVTQPYPNHNGGCLQFGPDEYLYCALGDGGNAGDPGNRAQNLQDTLGKILRIDVLTDTGFAVSSSNPYFNHPAALNLVWALGLRNPWKISFDRLTGDLWIADVGQSKIEEVNRQPAGHAGGINYGWRCFEGTLPYDTSGCQPATAYTRPVYEYPHIGPVFGCSVTGGYVYRGAKWKAMYGKYFFTDFCQGEIFSLHDSAGVWLPEFEAAMSFQGFGTFGQDAFGELYVAGVNSGNIFRLESTSCEPVALIGGPDTVFACADPHELGALWHPSLSYQWKKDGVVIPGDTTYRHTVLAEGSYTVVVTNDSCESESPPVYVDLCTAAPGTVIVFPNPAQDMATIEIYHGGGGPAVISVYNSLGGLCLQNRVVLVNPHADRFQLDVSALAQGMYLVHVATGSSDLTTRFAVMKPVR